MNIKTLTKKIGIIILIITCIVLIAFLILLYGPYNGFRDWLITTAMNTMNHQYLATLFYDEQTINECLYRNTISTFKGCTKLEQVQLVDYSILENIECIDKYEKEILDKESISIGYKIIEIEGEKYKGFLAVIYNPANIEVAVTKYLGESGQYLTTISEQTDAILAINGGGFKNGINGPGGEPLGITFSNNELVCVDAYNEAGGIIGLTNENKLFLGNISIKEAKNIGIRDSVSFGPYLIMNGESAIIKGNGGEGRAPRTAIGQRKDGIILMLVLDGDRTVGRGATILDVLNLMENYGAYNASCLDGGTSTGMTLNNKFINDPTTGSGAHKSRPIPTAFIYRNKN